MTKKRSTKRALLLSTLSLLLCVSMLIGSTFAWFTDEVKSGTNIIAAGNLDVELYYSKTKDFSDEKKVDGQTVLFTDKDGKEIKYWEPGVVAYTNLQVANVGSLALTYRLTVNSIATNYVEYADGSKYDLTDVLKVAVVKDGFEGDRADAKGLTFEAIESFTLSGELEAEKKSEVYGVVIYWEPNNNDFDNLFNMNNGKTTINGEPLSIELGITLSATQEEFEKDSFDETYDEEASYLVNKGEIVTFKPEDDSTELEMNGQVENNGVLSLVQTSMKNDGLVIENNGVANLTNVKAEVIPGEYWGGYFIHGVGKDSYTVFENVNATTLGGGVQLDDAAQAIFKSGSITTNSVSTNARHVFYLMDGSQITIEDGDFKFSPSNLTRKGYYVCATYGSEVIIKGGNFDKPSTRGDYKAGFYADATSSITIYGGTFKFDPTKWVADGYEAVQEGDTWTVKAIPPVENNSDLADAIKNKDTIVLGNGEYALPTLSGKDGKTIIGAADGSSVIGGKSTATGFGGNFGKNTTIKNVTFAGSTNGVRYSYAQGGTTVFENCTFAGDGTYGFHIDQSNGATFIFNNCTFSGFNAFASDLEKVVFNNCTFLNNGSYGHTNIWSIGEFNNCTWGADTSVGTKGSGKIFFDGVEESFYHEYIGTVKGLRSFRDSVKKGEVSKTDKYYLVNDIDLGGIFWYPIEGAFNATFDGQGHTIKNMDLAHEFISTASVAFFNNVSSTAVIKNVTFDNAKVSGTHYVAVILAGEWNETANATIDNCHVINSTVICDTDAANDNGDKAGAICGYAVTINITNCSVKDTTIKAYRDFGGILGCSNSKKINVTGNTAENVTLVIDNDVNYKNYTTDAEHNANAIVGRINAGNIANNTVK